MNEETRTFLSMGKDMNARGKISRLARSLDKAIIKAMREVRTERACVPENARLTATIVFARQEVDKMPKGFGAAFTGGGAVARISKERRGNGFLYQITYKRNGINITAMGGDVRTAKQNFIRETHLQEKKA